MKSEEIVTAVRKWLDGDDWHYEFNEEKQMIKAGVTLGGKIQTATMFIDFREKSYLVYVRAPICGDKDNLGELLKFIAMANYGLINGNFELDMRDGEVRYKTYVNCDGLDALSDEVIKASIYTGCTLMGRYGDGITALAFGFSDAETEIKKAEHPND